MMTEYPQNQTAEEAVLGAIMLEPKVIIDVENVLDGGEFIHPGRQLIYNTFKEMWEQNVEIDIITIQDALKSKGILQQIGGIVYLDQLFDNVPSSLNAKSYAEIVHRLAISRKIMAVGQFAWSEGLQGSDIDETVESLHRKLLDLSLYKTNRRAAMMDEAMVDFEADYLEKIRQRESGELTRPLGYRSGFQSLDDIIGGFRQSSYNVIAARPSIGKTAFAIAVSLNIAQDGGKVLFISLEMPFNAIINRMLANLTSINSLVIDRIVPENRSWEIKNGILKLKNYQMVVADIRITGSALSRITREIRYWTHKLGGLDFCVVDYLQLVTANAKNDAERIARVSADLKQLAAELEIPIMALAQINRTGRKNPTEDDIFGSDQPAHNGDLIITLSGNKGNPELKLNVVKHRFGSTGEFRLKYNRPLNQFTDAGALPSDRNATIDEIPEYDY